MSADTANTVIVAGWYPDPADDAQARWWDGSQWTTKTRPRHPVAPAAPEHGNRYFSPVPIRTDATLPPIDPYRPMTQRHNTQGHVSMDAKPNTHFHPTRSSTKSVWAIATLPLWSTILVLGLMIALGNLYSPFLIVATALLLFALNVLWAIHDRQVLQNSLHTETASPWWMLLGPMFYLIVRGLHVSRLVGRGWGPLIVYFLCTLVPGIAVLAFSAVFFVYFAAMFGVA